MRSVFRNGSRVLEAVHEGARDLYASGIISKRRMAHFDALCLEPPKYSPPKIKALRKRYQLSQSRLAAVLNLSLSTVRRWEQGQNRPAGPSLKLLDLLARKGLEGLA